MFLLVGGKRRWQNLCKDRLFLLEFDITWMIDHLSMLNMGP